MKKFLAIIALATFMTACNDSDSSKSSSTTDSTKMNTTTTPMDTTTKMAPDTSKMMNKKDTTKK